MKEAAMRTLSTLAAAAAASLALVACGGGAERLPDTPPPPPPMVQTAVPDSAIASSTALMGYLKAQKSDDETAEPLTLPAGDPATSETEEPQTV
ncbi:MAG TPA: hypothetical protein VIN03_00140, partial [Roseateles sp.]